MSESSQRVWLFYIDDMIQFSEAVFTYIQSMDRAAFIENRMTYDAVLRNLELIGEAATHIPEDIRSQYAHIPWRKIVATRNQLIHAYLGIDDDIVWSIIQDDLPDLCADLKVMRDAF